MLRRQATHDDRDFQSHLVRESETRLHRLRRELPLFRKSINDLAIEASERKFLWPLGPRPKDHPGLSDLGL